MKRLFDLALAALLLPIALLPMAVVALFIWAGDGRPVLFHQTRMGLGGRPFAMLKFRSMVINAEALGGYSTAEGDPRITPLGRFIRRTSLDELPQILNVLRGDMSFVGPRPETPAQVAHYTPEDWRLRCAVRPGITGPAQAGLRSSATPEQRLALDLAYARHAGLRRDIRLLGQTFLQLIRKGGN